MHFYERRLRRLLPALAGVILFTLLLAPFFLLPSEFRSIGRDALSALFFVANINYWSQFSYFSPGAENSPLLHTWSLGIEEQFYLFAPIFLWVVFRYFKRYRFILVGGLFLASFALCILLTPIKPSASFYLLPTRAWELLSGSLLALSIPYLRFGLGKPSRLCANFIGFWGLILLIYPITNFSADTQFPGYFAAVPVLGVVLLVLTGQFTVIGKILSTRPFIMMGLLSYSLYLWHWPLIVFFRSYGWLDVSMGKVLVIVLSILSAWLSWRYIERPTQNRQIFPVKKLLTGSFAIISVLISVSLIYSNLNGWPSRLQDEVVFLDDSRHDISPKRKECHFGEGLPSLDAACDLGEASPSIAVWGDSHGVELAYALSESGISVRQLTYSGCPPVLEGALTADRPQCLQHNRRVLEYLSSNEKYTTVVIAAYYRKNGEGSNNLTDRVAETAKKLVKAGKRVIVVGPMPLINDGTELPSYLARGGKSVVPVDDAQVNAFRESIEPVTEFFLPTDIFCSSGVCDLMPEGVPLLFDAHHPSMSAARQVASGMYCVIHKCNQDASLKTTNNQTIGQAPTKIGRQFLNHRWEVPVGEDG